MSFSAKGKTNENEPRAKVTIAWRDCYLAVQAAKGLIRAWEHPTLEGFADAMNNLHDASGQAMASEWDFRVVEIWGQAAIENKQWKEKNEKGQTIPIHDKRSDETRID